MYMLYSIQVATAMFSALGWFLRPCTVHPQPSDDAKFRCLCTWKHGGLMWRLASSKGLGEVKIRAVPALPVCGV